MPEVIKRRRNYSKIALTPEEANAFLDSQVWLRVATLDSDQEVWNLPTHFVRIGDSIYFDESPDSIMLANIERYHNVCGVVDTGYSYDDLVGTIIQGDASIVEEQQTMDNVIKSMNEKYMLLTRRPPVQDFTNRKFVKIEPYNGFDILSWNFGKGHL
ncbi:MAG: pyridoxamine 5'-phosphate oxidase family protein [Thaumarchaeota archaeon]|nr:pyridoxamine 5'-phosphate oxidase family protein [Nitrososphaerota archaeon]MDG6907661.1 pyridoxamine 5'-phosphate oxidase family protein [Nitrososphaerota archaeon]